MMPDRSRILLASAIVGAAGLVAQTLLLREDLVLYGGNEIALGAFLGFWLLAIALGALVARRMGERPERFAPALLLALGALPFVALLLGGAARGLSGVPAWEPFPLGSLFVWTMPVALPVSLATGAVFPALSGRARHEGTSITALYAAESAGAVLGGGVLTALLALGLDAAAIAIALFALCGAAAALLAAGRSRGWLFGLAMLAVATTFLGPRIDRAMHAAQLSVVLPGAKLDEAAETPAASYLAGHLGPLKVLVEDGRVIAAFPEPRRSAREAGFLGALTGAPRRLLVVGSAGFDLLDGLASLRAVDSVVWLVPDPGLVPLLGRIAPSTMANPRLRVVTGDLWRNRARLASLGPFDAVWLLAGTPTRAEQDRLLTTKAFSTLESLLAPGGRVAVPVVTSENKLGPTLRLAVGTVVAGVRSAFPAVRLVPGETGVVLGAARRDLLPLDPSALAAAWRRLQPTVGALDRASFTSLVDPERVPKADAMVATLLADPRVRPSTADRPLAVFRNLVVRASDESPDLARLLETLHGSGALVWVPLLTLFVLLLAGVATTRRPAATNRLAATLALAAAGACGMVLDLLLLHVYASRFGTLYLDLGLLVAAYMGGLAVGAAGGRAVASARVPTIDRTDRTDPTDPTDRSDPRGRLAAGAGALPPPLTLFPVVVFLVLASGAAALAMGGDRALVNRGLGLAALVIAGALSGAILPAGEALLARAGALGADAGAGIVIGDTLGGAVVGFAMGVVGIPVLGLRGAAAIAASVAGFGALALVVGAARRRVPRRVHLELLQAGYSALPFQRLARALLVLAILAIVGRFVVRAFVMPPAVHLSAQNLAATGLPAPFVEQERPIVHDVAGPNGQGGVALASRAAAPSVQGYGGPLNLLIAAKPDGHLAHVAFLEQQETPSYIDAAPAFFRSLEGLDLTRPIVGHPATEKPQAPPGPQDVDFITGASVTSAAVLDALNQTGQKLARPVFHRPYASLPSSHRLDPRWIYVAASLLLVVPLARWGRRRLRLATLAVHAVVGGVLLGIQFSSAQVLSILRFDPNLNLLTWGGLLLPGVVLLSALFGPLYCGYLCPAGAFGEALSLLGIARRLPRLVDRRARFVKYAVLAVIVIAVLGLGWHATAEADLLRTLFAPCRTAWALLLLAVVVAGSVLVYRFWCRYLCPTGAFLHLGNRVALLGGVVRSKRYTHCDLGVRGRLDVDCVQCDRCLDAKPLPEGARWRTHAFALLLAGSLAAMGGLAYSARTESIAAQSTGRATNVDVDGLRLRISAGTLSGHRAMWWEVAKP